MAKKKSAKKTKKKTAKKKKTGHKRGDRYKSLFNDSLLTINQFLVEIIYANNRIYNITAYIGGRKYRKNEYIKNVSIISGLLKRINPNDLYEIIVKNKVKIAEDLSWRVDKIDHLNKLRSLPKDYSDPKTPIFNQGEDLRKIRKRKKKKTLFEQIEEIENGDSNG